MLKKHTTKLVRWVSFSFVHISFEFFVFFDLIFTYIAYFLSSHSLQNLIFVGINIPLSNDFYQLLGNNADTILPSTILK